MTYIGTKNYSLEIAKGNVSGSALITKFGHNSDVDTASAEDVSAVAGAFESTNINMSEGYEIIGDGTLQFGVTANAVFTTNAPTWDVLIIGYEY